MLSHSLHGVSESSLKLMTLLGRRFGPPRALTPPGLLLIEIFLQRFCLHALYHATPTSLTELTPMLRANNLSPLPAVMENIFKCGVGPTPEALLSLKLWLPTPRHAESLVTTDPAAPELKLLLTVTNFLLELDDGMESSDMLKTARCLKFWRHIFDLHRHYLYILCQNLANIVQVMTGLM